MKLFVSYARVDKPLCKQIVHQLEAVHEVWYDRRLHAGQLWWDTIQEKLEWCEGFVYLLSPESVESEYCQKEYAIATNAGKHIFPVLIQARTVVPDSLKQIHYADLSDGMEDMITLMNALTIAERQQARKQPKPVPLPQQPAKPPQDVTAGEALGRAADALEDQNFDKAVFILKQALEKGAAGRIGRMLRTMLTDAEAALEQQTYLRKAEREYAPIRELAQREATRQLACTEFFEFQQDFPDYDPDNIAKTCLDIQQVKVATVGKPTILPEPFEWIDIPNGRVTLQPVTWTDDDSKKGYLLKPKTIDVGRFAIAKYPITNGQFAKFVEAGGYTKQRFWTQASWRKRKKDGWTEPRYWQDNQWNGVEQPVVGVSWYEAVAFCLWLGELTGENIMLPTEDQWQYAAQGDEGREYPWGNDWDCQRCNNSVSPCDSNATTPVRQYEDKGDSPFGVVDMAGNVWEWCLTDYHNGSNEISSSNSRVLRGGAWDGGVPEGFRCAVRFRRHPLDGYGDVGFRVSRS